MPSSAEISVVETFGSPKRLKSSSVVSRIRSAVRRGFFVGIGFRRWLRIQSSTAARAVHRLPPYNRGLHAGHFVRQRRQDVRLAARRRPRPRRRELRHRGGRVLRLARPERRRQDDPHQHPRRPRPRHSRPRRGARPRRRRRLRGGAAPDRRRAAGAGVRSVLHGARGAAHPGRLLRRARQRRLDRRAARQPRPGRQGRQQHAPAFGRHEAARAGRAGAGAPAAGDRPRRADRRRRRRAAPDALAVRRPPEQGRAHGAADDPLPRGSRGAVRPHRDAEAGPRRRPRPHLGAARRHRQHDAALQARQAAAAGAARQCARHRPDRPDHGARRARGRVDPRRAARRRLRPRRPRDRPRRPGGRVHRDHARRNAAAGWRHERASRRSRRRGEAPRPASSPARAHCSTRKCCASGR